MAFTVRIEGADADALQRRADAEHRSVEDLAREAIRKHVAHDAGTDLGSAIAAVHDDEDFTTRLDAFVERDQAILDRLAE